MISKHIYLTLPLRLSACDLVGFNVPDVRGCCCFSVSVGFPRTDCANGRGCDNELPLDVVLSFIVTVELFDGLGLYKQFGSISFPMNKNND